MTRMARTMGHTVVYMLGLVLNRGVAFLLVPFYTRALEPAVFARLDLCTATVLILLPIFELGMGTAMVRFYHLYDDADEQRGVTRTSFTFVLGAVAAWITLAFALAGPLSRVVFGVADQTTFIRLVAVTTGITVLGNQVLSLLRAQEKSVQFAVLNLTRSLVGPGAIVLLVVRFDMGLLGVLWGDIAGLATMTLVGLVMCRRWFGFGVDGGVLRRMLRFGVPLLSMGLATSIITLSDRYFLRAWVGLEGLAVYSLGFKVAMIITLVTRAFQTAWPASAYQIAKEPDGPQHMADIARFVLGVVLSIALLLTLASPELVRLFGGRELYAAGRYVVPWIAFSYAVYLAVLYVFTAVTIANRTGLVFIVVCGGCLAKIGLNMLLIKPFGALGAAASTLCAFVIELALGYVVAQRVYPVPYALGRIVPFAGIAAAAAVGAHWAGGLGSGTGVAVRAAIGLAFVGGALVTGLVTPAELRSACRHAGRLRERLFRRK